MKYIYMFIVLIFISIDSITLAPDSRIKNKIRHLLPQNLLKEKQIKITQTAPLTTLKENPSSKEIFEKSITHVTTFNNLLSIIKHKGNISANFGTETQDYRYETDGEIYNSQRQQKSDHFFYAMKERLYWSTDSKNEFTQGKFTTALIFDEEVSTYEESQERKLFGRGMLPIFSKLKYIIFSDKNEYLKFQEEIQKAEIFLPQNCQLLYVNPWKESQPYSVQNKEENHIVEEGNKLNVKQTLHIPASPATEVLHLTTQNNPSALLDKMKEYDKNCLDGLSYKQNDEFKTVYDHTLAVMNNFETYFKSHLPKETHPWFRFFLAFHDIGKHKKHLHSQDIGNIESLRESPLLSVCLPPASKEFAEELIGGDLIGLFMQGRLTEKKFLEKFEKKCKKMKISTHTFFKILTIYYQCDAGSYQKGLDLINFSSRMKNGRYPFKRKAEERFQIIEKHFIEQNTSTTQHTSLNQEIFSPSDYLIIDRFTLKINIPAEKEFSFPSSLQEKHIITEEELQQEEFSKETLTDFIKWLKQSVSEELFEFYSDLSNKKNLFHLKKDQKQIFCISEQKTNLLARIIETYPQLPPFILSTLPLMNEQKYWILILDNNHDLEKNILSLYNEEKIFDLERKDQVSPPFIINGLNLINQHKKGTDIHTQLNTLFEDKLQSIKEGHPINWKEIGLLIKVYQQENLNNLIFETLDTFFENYFNLCKKKDYRKFIWSNISSIIKQLSSFQVEGLNKKFLENIFLKKIAPSLKEEEWKWVYFENLSYPFIEQQQIEEQLKERNITINITSNQISQSFDKLLQKEIIQEEQLLQNDFYEVWKKLEQKFSQKWPPSKIIQDSLVTETKEGEYTAYSFVNENLYQWFKERITDFNFVTVQTQRKGNKTSSISESQPIITIIFKNNDPSLEEFKKVLKEKTSKLSLSSEGVYNIDDQIWKFIHIDILKYSQKSVPQLFLALTNNFQKITDKSFQFSEDFEILERKYRHHPDFQDKKSISQFFWENIAPCLTPDQIKDLLNNQTQWLSEFIELRVLNLDELLQALKIMEAYTRKEEVSVKNYQELLKVFQKRTTTLALSRKTASQLKPVQKKSWQSNDLPIIKPKTPPPSHSISKGHTITSPSITPPLKETQSLEQKTPIYNRPLTSEQEREISPTIITSKSSTSQKNQFEILNEIIKHHKEGTPQTQTKTLFKSLLSHNSLVNWHDIGDLLKTLEKEDLIHLFKEEINSFFQEYLHLCFLNKTIKPLWKDLNSFKQVLIEKEIQTPYISIINNLFWNHISPSLTQQDWKWLFFEEQNDPLLDPQKLKEVLETKQIKTFFKEETINSSFEHLLTKKEPPFLLSTPFYSEWKKFENKIQSQTIKTNKKSPLPINWIYPIDNDNYSAYFFSDEDIFKSFNLALNTEKIHVKTTVRIQSIDHPSFVQLIPLNGIIVKKDSPTNQLIQSRLSLKNPSHKTSTENIDPLRIGHKKSKAWKFIQKDLHERIKEKTKEEFFDQVTDLLSPFNNFYTELQFLEKKYRHHLLMPKEYRLSQFFWERIAPQLSPQNLASLLTHKKEWFLEMLQMKVPEKKERQNILIVFKDYIQKGEEKSQEYQQIIDILKEKKDFNPTDILIRQKEKENEIEELIKASLTNTPIIFFEKLSKALSPLEEYYDVLEVLEKKYRHHNNLKEEYKLSRFFWEQVAPQLSHEDLELLFKYKKSWLIELIKLRVYEEQEVEDALTIFENYIEEGEKQKALYQNLIKVFQKRFHENRTKESQKEIFQLFSPLHHINKYHKYTFLKGTKSYA